jgi:hypothetical protein
MVSEALPGVTPETKRTVLLGNDCAAAEAAKTAAKSAAPHLMTTLLLEFRKV